MRSDPIQELVIRVLSRDSFSPPYTLELIYVPGPQHAGVDFEHRQNGRSVHVTVMLPKVHIVTICAELRAGGNHLERAETSR